MRRYEALDSLRGVCACMVVLFHFKPNSHLVDLALVRHSYLFVDFFFVLSGFVIFEAYRDRLQAGFDVWRFAALRFGRLYPLHAFLLLCFVAYEFAWLQWLSKYSDHARVAFSGANSSPALIANFLLLNCFGLLDGTSWNYPAWSIGAEFWTYILFAVAVVSTSRVRLPTILVALAICGAAGVMAIGHGGEASADASGFPRCVFGFALGALLSGHSHKFISRVRKGSTFEIATILTCVAFVVVAGGEWALIAAPIVFAGAIAVFAAESGMISRLLLTRPLRKIGELSYSIYMVHVLVIMLTANAVALAEKLLGRPLRTEINLSGATYRAIGLTEWWGDVAYIMQLGLVVAAATLTFRFVERPSRESARRMVGVK